MTITYTIKNNTTAAVQLFKDSTGDAILKNGAGAAVRLAVGEQITSTELKDNRYKVIKGLAGWVDKSKMSLVGQVDNGPVDPPPVDPPSDGVPYSAEFVMLLEGGIDKIIIHGPKGAHANIFYDDGDGPVIAGF